MNLEVGVRVSVPGRWPRRDPVRGVSRPRRTQSPWGGSQLSARGNGGVLCGLVALAEHGRRHTNHCAAPGGLAIKGTGSVAALCLSFPILKVRSLHLLGRKDPMGPGHVTCIGRCWSPVRASAPRSTSSPPCKPAPSSMATSALPSGRLLCSRQSHPRLDDADARCLVSSLWGPQQPVSLSKSLKMPQVPSQQGSKPSP